MSNEANVNQTLILTADTSSARGSIAISLNNKLIAMLGLAAGEKRSTQLLAEIDWLIARIDARAADLTALAVVTGPGSFTGLRVGLATVKGFAHALAKPVIGMSSLSVYARAAGVSPATCVMIDAHRGEVFAQLFNVNSDGVITEYSDVIVAPAIEIVAQIAAFQQAQGFAGIVFCGDGALLHQDTIAAEAARNSQVFQAPKLLTAARAGWIVQAPPTFLAADAATYAAEKFVRGEVVAAQDLAAYYIRPAEAEVKLRLGLIGKKKHESVQP